MSCDVLRLVAAVDQTANAADAIRSLDKFLASMKAGGDTAKRSVKKKASRRRQAKSAEKQLPTSACFQTDAGNSTQV